MVESREAYVSREWLLHTSFIEAEVCSSTVPVQFQAPPTNPCLVRQAAAQFRVSSLLTPLPPACMAATLLQTAWHLPPYYPRLPGRKNLSLSDALILNAWPRTSYVTSYLVPPMMCYFCQFPHSFYLLLAVIFSQGKSSPGHRGIWGGIYLPWLCQESLYSLNSTYTFCPGQQHSHHLAVFMQSIDHFPLPPVQVCGEYALQFPGTPALYPITKVQNHCTFVAVINFFFGFHLIKFVQRMRKVLYHPQEKQVSHTWLQSLWVTTSLRHRQA